MNDVKNNHYEEYAAEASAAFFSEIVTYPSHTIWSVQQVRSAERTLSFRHAFRAIVSEHGYGGFYKGFSIAAIACLPGIMLYLWGAQCAVKWLECFDNDIISHFMEGYFAHAFAALILVPATRMIELEQASKISVVHHSIRQPPLFRQSKNIWCQFGVRGFYRGALPQFFVEATSDGVGFLLRHKLLQDFFSEKQSKHPGVQLFSTVIGFALGHFLLSPFSAVRTRMGFYDINRHVFKDTTFFPAMRTLYRDRGIKGFFVGASTSALYGALTSLPVACAGCFGRDI